MPFPRPSTSPARRLLAVAAAVAVAVPLVGTTTTAAAAAPSAPVADRTVAAEARRVDRVPTPKIAWFPCPGSVGQGDCATLRLPLDYDDPTGPTTTVALGRVRAVDPARKIGTLFVNPGGPGGSAVQIALAAPFFLGRDLLERFDVVGVDPRGIGYSAALRCFPGVPAQGRALAGLQVPFPLTAAEEKAYVASSAALGRGCATTGQPLAGSMSTAEVARDMDVVRRAVGDDKLTYLGFSYGTQLGQTYANMFPDRVRRIVVDGVLDPVGWAGTPATKDRPVTDRILSADGASQALTEFLRRCDAAGRPACPFANGDPQRRFAVLADRLKAQPVVIEDPFGSFTVDYPTLVSVALGSLYDPAVGRDLAAFLQDMWVLSAPQGVAAADVRAARTAVARHVTGVRERAAAGRLAFPYDNSIETFTAVLCSDSLNPADGNAWRRWAPKADARAPYFGRAWLWGSAPCAADTWGAVDEDAYRGPFTKRTAAPVLVVGNLYDPATNYAGAVKAFKLLPNSRLVSSDSWGHTAYGTSACVDDAVHGYLLGTAMPRPVTSCVGDAQPFQARAAAKAARDTKPAPIAPFVPGL